MSARREDERKDVFQFGIDPPPSRRVVDRYGLFGIVTGALILLGLLIVLTFGLIVQGATWLWNTATKGDES